MHSSSIANTGEPPLTQVLRGDLSTLVAWGAPAEPRRGPLILLADGGLLVANVLDSDDSQLTVDSALLGKLAIPLEHVTGIAFFPPLDPRRRDALIDNVRNSTAKSDRLVLENGDEISGVVEALSAQQIELKAETGALKLETDRVLALMFDPSLIEAPPTKGLRTIVGLNDGSRLVATKASPSDDTLQMTLAGGQKAAVALEAIVFLQPLGGKIEYLSDRKPTGYKHVPFLDLPREYWLDRNALGTTLRSGGRMYLKGVGMHSASRLTFPLDGRHKRFAADVAIDDAAGPRGSVTYRVFVDAEQKYVSPIIRGGEAPVAISVDLPADARSLSLIVDFADRGDELDYANWLNARLEE